MKTIVSSIIILFTFYLHTKAQDDSDYLIKKNMPSFALSNSIIYVAIKNRDVIGLNLSQLKLLLLKGKELDSLVNLPRINFTDPQFNSNKFQKDVISSILDSKQVLILKQIENQSKAVKNSISYWNELKNRKMSSQYDSILVIKEMENYELKRLNVLNLYEDSITKQEAFLKQLEHSLPKALWKLRIARRIDSTITITPKPSKFFTAIALKKDLNITDIQIDSLAVKGFEMDHIFWVNNKYKERGKWTDPYRFESNYFPKILSEDQYTKFLIIISKKAAKNDALNSWINLRKSNLVNRKDSVVTTQKLFEYYLAYKITFERYKKDRDQRISSLKTIDETMPDPLRKLKAIQADSTGTTKHYRGTFKW